MKWGPFSWGEELLGDRLSPRYYGLAFWGFQIGYWERPHHFRKRYEAAQRDARETYRAKAGGGQHGNDTLQ